MTDDGPELLRGGAPRVAEVDLVVFAAEQKKTQFAVTLGLLAGDDDGEDTGAGICPGLRVDFYLTKSFMIRPEASLLWGGAVSSRFFCASSQNSIQESGTRLA
jgi:hypothetical protein